MTDAAARTETIEPVNTDTEEETDLSAALFHAGTCCTAWEYLGVHSDLAENGSRKYTFRVWAPHAVSIAVVGDLSDWENGLPMTRITDEGIWELILERENELEGSFYKYAITGQDGVTWLKADPYAAYSESMQNTASIVYTKQDFFWHDSDWMKKRRNTVCPKARGFKPKYNHFYSAPMHIYEMHLGSWKTLDGASNTDGAHYLTYRAIADMLAPYLSDMGYTHVELLPVMEHPYDGSLGYQICGYFAPTSRYGTPADFKYFVDKMHTAGIGVILDWVPAFFPKDRHGLYEFDGQPLYEYGDPERREYSSRNSRFFDISCPEVRSFLVSNAMYWLGEFHADGLRVNAVDVMLYPAYEQADGKFNAADEQICEEAVSFFRELNSTVHGTYPDALMIAEDGADLPMLTDAVAEGGLGFSFKWNVNWTEALFSYVRCDPIERKHIHDTLTAPLTYAFRDHHILPVSHTDVSGGKKSLVDKMFGEYDNKFAGMRTFMLYMMTMPGKKLTFMGCEFAQFREWDYTGQLEWFMIDYPRHIEMQRFFRALNHLYLESSPLWDIDDTEDGFAWIDADQADLNILSYRRRDKKGQELIVILNFSPVVREGYTLFVPKMGRYEEVLTTDRYEFGGRNRLNEDTVRSVAVTDENGSRKNQVTLTLPALGGVVLRKQLN